jgi:hypothetical protein
MFSPVAVALATPTERRGLGRADAAVIHHRGHSQELMQMPYYGGSFGWFVWWGDVARLTTGARGLTREGLV